MDQEHGSTEPGSPPAGDPVTLGRYRITGSLGVGPMGRVLLGVDESGRRAAVRVVHPQLAGAPGFRERFRHEVQVAANAPAWFVAPVLDADPDAELPWLATAYVEGPPLHRFVAEHGPLGRQGTVALAVRVAEGLVALHATGLVHRDLKPSNVLLADDGPRLVDFGIARAGDGTPAALGPVVGTPAFLSPELVAGVRDPGPASDMFSFGSVVAFAAAGRSPFAAESPAAEANRVATAPPDLGPLDGGLREIVVACLNKDPAARPTAAQVRDRLRALDEPGLAGAGPTTAAPPAVPPAVPAADAPTAVVSAAAAPTVVVPATGAPTAAIPAAGPPAGHYAPPTAYGPPVLGAPPPPRRRRNGMAAAIVAAVVAAAAVVVAVVMLLDRGGADPAPVAAAPPTGGATTSAAPPTSGAPVQEFDVATDGRFGTGSAHFATPSGNIACVLAPGEARCDVRQRTWQIPAKPADCAAAYGTGAVLTAGQAGQLSCVSDTLADPRLTVLAYGQAVRLGDVVCVSRETGVRCEDERSGHGFSVARASYDLF